jgi:sec-independent protein translocase protein TatA
MGFDNPLHLAFLALLLLLVFGAKRLPEMGRSLGAGMRGFRESISGESAPATSLSAPAEMPAKGGPLATLERGEAGSSPERAAHGAVTAPR